MEKVDKLRLVLALIFGIAAVIRIVALWMIVALINLIWGAAIILQGSTLEYAKAATYPLRIVVFILGVISGLALIKGDV